LDKQPSDGFKTEQWLELSTAKRNANKMPGDMVQITAVNNLMVTVSGSIGTDIIDAANNPTW